MPPDTAPLHRHAHPTHWGDAQGLPVKHPDVPVAEEFADRAKQLEEPEGSSQDEQEDQQGAGADPVPGGTDRREKVGVPWQGRPGLGSDGGPGEGTQPGQWFSKCGP